MAIVGVNGRWGAATAAAKGKGYTQANGTLNRRRQHHRVRGMRKQNDWQGDCKWRGQRGESRRPGELHEDDHGHWHIDHGRPWLAPAQVEHHKNARWGTHRCQVPTPHISPTQSPSNTMPLIYRTRASNRKSEMERVGAFNTYGKRSAAVFRLRQESQI